MLEWKSRKSNIQMYDEKESKPDWLEQRSLSEKAVCNLNYVVKDDMTS